MSHLWKVDDFKNKLEAKLSEPFSRKELEELAAAASHRKPICKVRETRQGCFPFMSEQEGFSYLDHHPGMIVMSRVLYIRFSECLPSHMFACFAEMDFQLEQAINPVVKLSLLRGFFFWLEVGTILTKAPLKPVIIISSVIVAYTCLTFFSS